jgi:hypothetical protein
LPSAGCFPCLLRVGHNILRRDTNPGAYAEPLAFDGGVCIKKFLYFDAMRAGYLPAGITIIDVIRQCVIGARWRRRFRGRYMDDAPDQQEDRRDYKKEGKYCSIRR